VQPSAIAGSGYADDIVTMALQSATQWDALSHAFYDYRMYNDRDCRLVTTTGAAANAIDRLGARVAGRGVLIDVARFLGQESLSPGHEITTAELQGALEYQATEIEQGDILLIRTGHMKWARRNGGWDDFVLAPEPGIGLDVLPWLHDGGVAGVAADNWALEVVPGVCSIPYPVHAAGIVHMGLLIGEMFDLESLADDCAQDGTYEFFFCAPPLPFAKAVGSPVNPVALK
jgi:kynurenine formamidase